MFQADLLKDKVIVITGAARVWAGDGRALFRTRAKLAIYQPQLERLEHRLWRCV